MILRNLKPSSACFESMTSCRFPREHIRAVLQPNRKELCFGDNTSAEIYLSRFIGVADMANVRFSLPAQLMEPIPNLGILCLLTRGWTQA